MRPPYRIDYGSGSDPRVIRRGDAWTVPVFEFRSPAGEGAAWWDGYAVKAQLRASIDGDLLHEFDLGAEVSEEDGIGILTLQLYISAEDSAALSIGPKIGDIEITTDFLPKFTAIAFRVPVVGDVTHE